MTNSKLSFSISQSIKSLRLLVLFNRRNSCDYAYFSYESARAAWSYIDYLGCIKENLTEDEFRKEWAQSEEIIWATNPKITEEDLEDILDVFSHFTPKYIIR